MFCSNCGAEVSEQAGCCEKCGHGLRRSVVKWLTVVVAGLIVLAVLSTLGYRYYRVSQLKSKLETAMGTDAGYTETILKIESDASNITYNEIFALCDKSVEDRQKLIVELRGLYPGLRYELKDKLIEFLNAENELIRSKSSFYRQRVQLSAAMELWIAVFDMPTPTSLYGWDYYYNSRETKLRFDARVKAAEMITSADSLLSAYQKIAAQEEGVAAEMERAGMRFVRSIKRYQSVHSKKALEAKESAEKVRATFAS